MLGALAGLRGGRPCSALRGVGAGLVVDQGGACSFLHDRIQEASYALIPEAIAHGFT